MQWQNTIQDYLEYLLIEKGLSENSIDNYKRDISKLANYLQDYKTKKQPSNISSEEIKDFLYNHSKKVQARSQARLISGLKSFFKFLILENYREDNPMDLIESPKIGLKLPDSLSDKEIRNIIANTGLSNDLEIRNNTILETLYNCGLRVSELINLKISDLFFEDGFIKVTGKGNKQRLIPTNLYIEDKLSNYINNIRIHTTPQQGNEDYIFLNRRGKKLTRVMIFTIIKNTVAKTENTTQKVSPHTFRHSFASELLKGGADLTVIQALLGHESITTTEIYLHVDKTKLKEVVALFHPRSKNRHNL